jgi:hypothetical protein
MKTAAGKHALGKITPTNSVSMAMSPTSYLATSPITLVPMTALFSSVRVPFRRDSLTFSTNSILHSDTTHVSFYTHIIFILTRIQLRIQIFWLSSCSVMLIIRHFNFKL